MCFLCAVVHDKTTESGLKLGAQSARVCMGGRLLCSIFVVDLWLVRYTHCVFTHCLFVKEINKMADREADISFSES